ncbi:HNH endonuclease signature motif containing protein [Microbacterium sp. SLBN-146]|uniref:HNH endonuclease signature motif containing protein n=1 Tax=Microbacterium sp. SLBN-146 TaxID=2768457 RepID=UPI0011510E59|nr:HNH endonuclease signature motif containing protein [Microbacterium sp. SLBN-146]TQJ31630.1 5-methylcytosine-specific restriction protein A [Microbacterium sp. SLBN-146]
MEALLETLRTAITPTRDRVREVFAEGGIRWTSDEQIIDALGVAAELQRLTDAVMIEAVGEISRRSQERDREQRLTSRRGCHDVGELVQRVTRLGVSSAARLQRGAKVTMVRVALNGDAMPGLLPAMREALADGEVGIDGLIAVAGPLQEMSPRVSVDDLRAADALLAAEARGEGPDGSPAACAELLRVQARAWAAYLDQDGAEPREEKALRLRGITLGRARDGVVPLSGTLLAEVAAQFARICHAIGSPRVSTDGPVMFRPSDEVRDEDTVADRRTSAQKRHDAFATALFTAASSELLPTIGGAAPTLVVSVREQDLVQGRGWAHLDDGEPVSLTAATHVGCSGVVQRIVQSDDGRILRIGTEDRVFNRHQRRAIALRDGGCLIPGCGVPAGWCEIHHVVEHAKGGPTHTDNGVLLCWFHHRHLDHHGWQVRMNHGVPEVLAPPWIEARPRWRPATTSPTRLFDLVSSRRAAP